MKHSRFLAAATATTVALTIVVPAHAAQIGPLDQNKCTLTLTTAELDQIHQADKAFAEIPEWKFDRDMSLAFEQIFDIRGTGDNFVSTQAKHFSEIATEEAFEDAYAKTACFQLSRTRRQAADPN